MAGTILVTGAGGFIGKHVCSRLADAGWTVRAAVRSSEPPPRTQSVYLNGSESAAALRDLLRDIDAVVHLAGRAHVLRETAADPQAAFRADNVELTAKLAEAAAAAGVRDFILMSSIAAVSNAGSGVVSDDLTHPPDTVYGLSKLQAEDTLFDLAHGHALRVVVLRPPMVYGEEMRGNPQRLFHHLARGLPLPVLKPAVRRSLLYVGNLAEAVLTAVNSTDVHGRFCVTDGDPLTLDEFARAVASALGRRARLVPVSHGMLRLAGVASEAAGRVLPLRLNRRTVARLSQSLIVDGSRFTRLTGFMPLYSWHEAVERTARWFLAVQQRRRV